LPQFQIDRVECCRRSKSPLPPQLPHLLLPLPPFPLLLLPHLL
jgi:hypothetical protein